MIRLLVRLAAWLDSRFPAKVVVTEANYRDLEHTASNAKRNIQVLESGVGVQFREYDGRIGSLEAGLASLTLSHEHVLHDIRGLRAEVEALKASVSAIKEVLAKSGANVVKPEKEQLRAAFIAGNFNRGPDRATVEAG